MNIKMKSKDKKIVLGSDSHVLVYHDCTTMTSSCKRRNNESWKGANRVTKRENCERTKNCNIHPRDFCKAPRGYPLLWLHWTYEACKKRDQAEAQTSVPAV